MKDLLDTLSTEQQRLNAIDDQLSQVLKAVESQLAERVSIRIEIACESASFTKIAYGKISAGWCLQVERGGVWHALLQASRECRAEAIAGGHVRALLEDSVEQVRRQTSNRATATKAAAELMTMLGANRGDQA